MPAPLQIAVAQPPCTTGSPAENAEAHALTVLAARARLVVFPELSLSGYDLDAPTLAVDDPVLGPVVEACGTMNTVALLGAPTSAGDTARDGLDRSISVVLVDAGGARVVYRKQHLGAEEREHFSPGPRPVVLDLDGWRVGLGVCRDTGVGDHVKELADAGIDLYVAGLVDRPSDLAVQRVAGGRDRQHVRRVRGVRELRRTDGGRVRRDRRTVGGVPTGRDGAGRDLGAAGWDRPGAAGLT